MSVTESTIESGLFPPDEFQAVLEVLFVDTHLVAGEFLIDCEDDDGNPAIAAALADGDELVIVRAWRAQDGLEYLEVTEAACSRQ